MFISRALVAALVVGVAVQGHSTERNPLSYLTRLEDAVISTPSQRVHALSSFELTFLLHDGRQKIRLSLSPNHDILSEDATIQHIGPDGLVYTEPIERSDHRIFKGDAYIRHPGHSEWTNAGWARITVRRDGPGPSPVFDGAFRIDGDVHHIQTGLKYRQTKVKGDPEAEELGSDEYMVVWRDSDVTSSSGITRDDLKRDLSGQQSCASDHLLFNRDGNHPVYRSLLARDPRDAGSLWSMGSKALFGRQIDGTTGGNGAGVNLTSTIGSTTGCPTTRKIALVGIATDCTYTAKFNSTQSLREHVIGQVNLASQVYESTFNISLAIQNLTISNEACPSVATTQAPWNVACSDKVTIKDRLNQFSHWRGQFNDTNAYWTLLSTCATDNAIGLAWLGQLCVQGAEFMNTSGENETVAGANVVTYTSKEWEVIAHETGHLFGAVHDCTANTCADGTVTKQECCPLSSGTCNANGAYIMHEASGRDITQFSPCSVGNICSAIGRNSIKTGCLTNNRDVNTISGSQCGNGIVESGEECDCGGFEGCGSNPCCDPVTCKFKGAAVCDPANEECCTTLCTFSGNGTVCRESTGACDPAETCNGYSPVCPVDVSAPDGTSCGASDAGLACASGQCTSRDLQCKTVMGSMTASNNTYACPRAEKSCLLSCASPDLDSDMCYESQQNFLDGTPCGGGKCANGVCQGYAFRDTILYWIRYHPQIFYPVVIIAGLLILAVIAWICVACWRLRKRKVQVAKGGVSPPGTRSYGPGQGGPPGMNNRRTGPPPPGALDEHRQHRVQGAFGATRYA